MASIGLCMIVKNEAHVITRCLDSVRTLVDYVLVEDTGSTDGTQQLVADWLARENLPGQVIEEPWRDFAYNRSHALAALRAAGRVDYAMMIDADDELAPEPGFDPVAFKANLRADALRLTIVQEGVSYDRLQICSTRMDFRYRGVLHEFLESPEGAAIDHAAGFQVISGREGARNQDPDKYRRDAALLEAALAAEADPALIPRYRFYLAQSWRDAGEKQKALDNYLIRAGQAGWLEEVFCSQREAGKLMEALDAPPEEVIGAYLRAGETLPGRAEGLYHAARYCLLNGRMEEGYQYALRGIGVPKPLRGLFLETYVYDYGLLDTLAIGAGQTGRLAECVAASERMLEEGWLPAQHRAAVLANKAAAAGKLLETDAMAPVRPDAFTRLLRTARAKETVRQAPPKVLAAYAAASAAAPHRAEGLHDAARFCRNNGLFEEGCKLAREGLAIPQPPDAPGDEAWIYAYGLLDELMANAFWAGRYAESAEACERLLRENRTPPEMRERIARNRDVLTAKLREA